MSSELHEVFRRDLDKIALRPETEWVPPVRRHAPRPGWRGWRPLPLAARGLLVTVLVIVSMAGGLLLTDIRRQIATNVTSPGTDRPAYIPERDLVHLAVGGEGERGLLSVEMPEGRVVGRHVGESYVGTDFVGSPIVTGRELAFIPVITQRPGETAVSLRGIDLRNGREAVFIEAGNRPFSASRDAGPELRGIPNAEAVPTHDGAGVLLVRDTGPDGVVTLLERYDGRTGALLASRQWTADGRDAIVRARLVPVADNYFAVVRNFMSGTAGAFVPDQQVWHFVDAELNEISTFNLDRGYGVCEQILAVPTTNEWAMVCFDPSGSAGSRVIFLDQRFREVARVDLDRQYGNAERATVMQDGTIAAVTGNRVVRIDPTTHSLIDRRIIRGLPTSLLDLLSASAALAKGPTGPGAAFSLDGSFAYESWSTPGCVACVALIDLRQATVVAQSSHSGQILLSPDGGRLYVLTGRLTLTDPSMRLVLLDPGSLREIAATEPLAGNPFSLIAIGARR